MQPSHAQLVSYGPRANVKLSARRSLETIIRRALPIAVLALVYNDIFGAVIRFVAVTVGAPWLSYAPMLFAVFVVIAALCLARLPRGVWLTLGLFASYAYYTCLVGGANTSLLTQLSSVGFALYTWTPFFLGLVLASLDLAGLFARASLLWWSFAVAGVIVNTFLKFPWTGTTFEVLGQQAQVARDWTTNGVDRLAGFSRASFAAANQIALFSMVLAARARMHALVKVLIWAVSVLAIALTTSKTPLMLMVVVPAALLSVRCTRIFAARDEFPFYVAMLILLSLLATTVALPCASTTQDLLASTTASDFGFLTLSSLLDRASTMWPAAFELIASDKNPIEWVLGRGLGGIGAAQAIFEPLKVNSADNLFVFLYVSFGLGSLLFGVAILAGFKKYYDRDRGTFTQLFALAASVLTLGIATNVIESVIPALVTGMLVAKSFD
ncbi:MAG TPA: hypothetical protein VFK05_04095 [Polyangiaceae bacterium]|nr:hypothetical protein [Polyangiaceae bacterium]